MFVDERTINIAAGRGGNGVVRWRKEKYISKGGPAGGDGGAGGDVYILAVRDINILRQYRENEKLSAEDGSEGGASLIKGKRGEDLIVRLPLGSIVKNLETHEEFQLLQEGQKILVAAGGHGGFGNAHFKSSKNTTPTTAKPGGEPQAYRFHIEMRIIADAGIIGLPSAGKSTLLNALTNSQVKVASYHFTTLEPNLGIFHSYVLADIPGLIENASAGKGLGHKFLKHIQRTRMLVHLISAEEEDPAKAYEVIRKELGLFDKQLLDKQEIVVVSKVDMVDESRLKEILAELPKGAIPLSVLDDSLMKQFSTKLSQALTNTETS